MSLIKIITGEMGANGVLPFARFMELALYCPVYGFYEKEKDSVGRDGDFYTSVSAGSLFGGLLAFQFAQWLEELGRKKAESRKLKADGGKQLSPLVTRHLPLCIVEAGAHDGRLAADILNWLQERRPTLFEQIKYIIIEPSARRQEWQRETLKEFAPRVHWQSAIGNRQLCGIIFSNELLDAMPVHRLGWNAKTGEWFEWGVALDGENFVWTKIQTPDPRRQTPDFISPSSILHPPPSLLAVLPDGYTIEISPAAETWWREAAGILSRGKLLTIDYGFTESELFSPTRTGGTLRSYRAHRHAENILTDPGEQDITAHINFAAIQAVGEQAGLKTDALISQPQFLTRILEKTLKEKNSDRLTAAHARQFQTLTHPEHLGRAFRVLIQSR